MLSKKVYPQPQAAICISFSCNYLYVFSPIQAIERSKDSRVLLAFQNTLHTYPREPRALSLRHTLKHERESRRWTSKKAWSWPPSACAPLSDATNTKVRASASAAESVASSAPISASAREIVAA